MAIKMTREEYEKKYGQSPSISSDPIKMTQEEYDKKYGKPGLLKETLGDIKEIGTGIGESFKRRDENIKNINKDQRTSSKIIQGAGQTVGFLGDVIGETLIGAGKVLLPSQKAEEAIGRGVTSAVSSVVSTKPVQSAIQRYQEFKAENPEIAANIEGVANIGDFALNFVGAGAATKGGKLALTAGKDLATDTLESRFIKEATEIAKRGATGAKGAVVKTPEQAVQNVSKNLIDLLSTGGSKQARQRVIEKYIPQEIDKFIVENGYFNKELIQEGRFNVTKSVEKLVSDLSAVDNEVLNIAKNTDQTFTRDELVNSVLKNIDAEKFPLANIEKLQKGITGIVDRYLTNKGITGDIPAFNILDIRRQLDKKAFNAGKALKTETADIFRSASDGVRDIVNTKISGGDLGDLLNLERKLILSKDFLNDLAPRAIKGGKLTDLAIRGASGLATAGAVGGVKGLIAGAIAQYGASKVASALARKSIVGITESGALKKAAKEGLQTVIDEGGDILSFAKKYNLKPESAKKIVDEIASGTPNEETLRTVAKSIDELRVNKESEIENKILELDTKRTDILNDMNRSISTIKAIDDVDTLTQHLIKVHNIPEEIASKYAPVLAKLDKVAPLREQFNNMADEVLTFVPKQADQVSETVAKKVDNVSTKITTKKTVNDNLIQEAKKYKSAEEFVKAQGETVYRGEGGSNVAQGKALLAEGKHFASDAEYPKGFGEVREYVIKPNAKVLDLGDSDFAEISQKLGIPEKRYISPKELSTIAREKGYDVLQYNGEYKSTGKQFTHTVDLAGDSYVTKSQLTDIWNKAQSSNIVPSTGDDLIQEAKKYKSAEEFVKEHYKIRNVLIPENNKMKYRLSEIYNNDELYNKYPIIRNTNISFIPRRNEILDGANGLAVGNDIVIADDLIKKTADVKKVQALEKKLAPYLEKEASGKLSPSEYNEAVRIIDEIDELVNNPGATVELTDDALRVLAHELQHIKQGIGGKGVKRNIKEDVLAEFARSNPKIDMSDYYGNPAELEARMSENKIKTKSQLEQIWNETNNQ